MIEDHAKHIHFRLNGHHVQGITGARWVLRWSCCSQGAKVAETPSFAFYCAAVHETIARLRAARSEKKPPISEADKDRVAIAC